jgi:hypothetical protein
MMSDDLELARPTILDTSDPRATAGEPSHLTATPHGGQPADIDVNAMNAASAETGFSDGSEALLSIYLDRARVEDQKMTDSWKGDADGILFFVCKRENILTLSTPY